MNQPNIQPSGYDLGMPQYAQIPVSSDELNAHYLQEERVRNTLSQISPDNQLYEIEMRIRGYRKVNGEWMKREGQVEINDLLVERYISYLSSIMNQSTTMSNLSQQQVARIMKLVVEFVTDDIDANAEKYGFAEDYSERTRVGHILLNTTFLVMNRALNGQEARRMWASLSLTESANPNQQQKQGIMDWIRKL